MTTFGKILESDLPFYRGSKSSSVTVGPVLFESVFIRTPNENSVLTPEAPEKRESESSEPIFRTDGRNLEGCVRETEISLQTESAAI